MDDRKTFLRKPASYSAQKKAEYRKQWALIMSYHRDFPSFPVEPLLMFHFDCPQSLSIPACGLLVDVVRLLHTVLHF